jgi:hypothetical protein
VGGQHHAPTAFTPEKDPVPIVQEAGWASESVWIAVENFAPTGIRSSDLPAPSESLYRLSYPGSELNIRNTKNYGLLTPWSRVLPEKLKRPELLKKFPAFYGT